MQWLKRLFGCKPNEDPESYEFPAEQRFPVGEKEIVVRPLTIRRLREVSTEFALLLQRIIREHPDLDLARFDEHLVTLLPALTGILEEFLGKLFDIDPAYLVEHLEVPTAVRVVRALLEVNQVPFLRREAAAIRELWSQVAA